MWWKIVTVLALPAGAALFWYGVDVHRLFAILQPIGVNLSIMIAAVFVRLNRGMPTLDWKALDPDDRLRLTSSIVAVTSDYARVVAWNAGTLIFLMVLIAVGQEELQQAAPMVQQLISAAFGAAFAACLARMGYIIWRDVDIVHLQRKLIDDSAIREQANAQTELMTKKITDIRGASLRPVASPKPKEW